MKLATAFILAASAVLTGGHASADRGPCMSVTFERSDYTVCEVDLRKHAIKLYWKRPDGAPYAYLRALPQSLEASAARGKLMFATNAGMFDPELKRVGLYVEKGRQ